MDDVIDTYFEAWNEAHSERRRALLERSITPDAQLVDPTGRWRGIEGLSERIGNYLPSAPGTRVVLSSGAGAAVLVRLDRDVDAEVCLADVSGEDAWVVRHGRRRS